MRARVSIRNAALVGPCCGFGNGAAGAVTRRASLANSLSAILYDLPAGSIATHGDFNLVESPQIEILAKHSPSHCYIYSQKDKS